MDKFFVNPGSATGAFSTGWGTGEGEEEEVVPSFCLMDVGCAPHNPPPFARCCWPQAARGLNGGQRTQGFGWNLADMIPIQVQGISLTLYVYQLRKDENGAENVAVEKVTYTKPVEPTGAS